MRPKKAIMSPSRWATASIYRSLVTLTASGAGEQALHLLDVAPVRQEHDHVIVVVDHGVVVSDRHVVAAYHRADDGALGKRNLPDLASHDAGGLVGAVNHGLERLGRAASQAVHAHHVATAHVRQQ